MIKFTILTVVILALAGPAAFGLEVSDADRAMDIELLTSEGKIIVRLSDKTPLHRDNFIMKVKSGFYDNIRYHRIIENFVIQTGNPNYKDPPYEIESEAKVDEDKIPPEFDDSLFHRRGALSAARNWDDFNPQQLSSASQFVIVQGKKYPDAESIEIAEGRLNGYLAYNKIVNDPVNAEKMNRIKEMNNAWPFPEGTEEAYEKEYENITADFKTQTDALVAKMELFRFPDWQREIYRTEGGNAHSDKSYTVFGEVVDGMDVVDRLAAVETDDSDVPTGDVRIVKAVLIERKKY